MQKLFLMVLPFILLLSMWSCKDSKKEIEFTYLSSKGGNVAAQIDDHKITFDVLEKDISAMINEAKQKLFFTKLNRLRTYSLEYFMNNDPRKKGLSNEEFLDKYIVKKITVGESEIKRFAEAQKIDKETLSKGDMKSRISQYLEMQKKREMIEAWLDKVSKGKIIVGLENTVQDNAEYKDALKGVQFGKLNAGMVLKIDDKEFSDDELMMSIRNEIFEIEDQIHQMRIGALKSVLVDYYVGKMSKSVKAEEYLEKNVFNNISVSDKEISDFADARKIPPTAVNDQLTERIKDFIKNSKKKDLMEEWLKKQIGGNKVSVYFMPPERPVFKVNTDGSVFAGGQDAKVVVAEFTDFQCPFCAKGSEVMKDLKAKYGDKIKVVFKHYPLPFHKDAKFAHEVAYCASEQDKKLFWNLYRDFFGDQSKLGKDSVLETAKKLSIDNKKLDDCLKSGKAGSVIDKDLKEGQEIGVNSTPTFFVNGKIVMGAQEISVFSELIDQELSKKN